MSTKPRGRRVWRLGVVVAVVGVAVTVAATAGQATRSQDGYTLGLSNTLVGNGWREGQLCAFKVQALASGKVDSLKIAHRATDTAGQISDIRAMISSGVDAIVINPSSPTALKPVAAQALARGIKIIFIDQYVNAPGAYNATNDQVGYARLGATWLFKKIGGRGNVVELRGFAGVPADTDRHKGFRQALKAFPNIKVVKSVFTGWQFAPAGQAMLDILNSGTDVDGVWTSGTDYTVVDAFKTAGKPYVPVVGADNYGFVRQLKALSPKFQGAAVTNPSSIGGVGVTQAIRVLDKRAVPKWIKLTPDIWTWPQDRASINKYAVRGAPADASAQLQLPPWTTYTLKQYRACKGP
jgi:ribose transport system substrate-binding protein